MSARRADPRAQEFDNALRSALHLAVDAIEPGQDGLDQIRSKIAVRQSARRRASWRRMSLRPDGDQPWWRALRPPRGWLPAVVGAVVERFRPDPNRAGWFGWLRPAAAVTTGLFVVTAASLAVAALPSVIETTGSAHHYNSPSPIPKHRTSAHHQSVYPTGSTGGTSPVSNPSTGGPSPSSTPSCTPSASGTPSGSPSTTPTTPSTTPTTPSTTPTSPSTTPTTPSTSPAQSTPSSTPTIGGPSQSVARPAPQIAPTPASSPYATGKALISQDAVAAKAFAGASAASGVDAASDGYGDAAPPTPPDSPQPTVSPTISVPTSPYPTTSPLPPPQC